jgi:hypothetical protein
MSKHFASFYEFTSNFWKYFFTKTRLKITSSAIGQQENLLKQSPDNRKC